MRICLLTNQDLDEDPFPAHDWPCDPRPYVPEAEWHVAVLDDRWTSVRAVKALIREGFDLFFNLCDGSRDEDEAGIEVIRCLERAGVPFTGSTSAFFEPSRITLKRTCKRLGIASPAYVMARNEDDVERAARRLRFPLFVKHPSSHASVDLTRASRVVTPAGLRRQARRIMRRRGRALIEEFIAGDEATVLVAENPRDRRRPTTYTPIRYVFPHGESFKHENMKWVEYDRMQDIPVEDPRLARRLRRDAARIFVGLRGASYGRADFRVDAAGTPYLLEINANPGIYYPESAPGSADLCLLHSPGGHEAFTRQIVRAALTRRRPRSGNATTT